MFGAQFFGIEYLDRCFAHSMLLVRRWLTDLLIRREMAGKVWTNKFSARSPDLISIHFMWSSLKQKERKH